MGFKERIFSSKLFRSPTIRWILPDRMDRFGDSRHTFSEVTDVGEVQLTPLRSVGVGPYNLV